MKVSAGLLLYRRRGACIEVFLVHPGGPFWARKDEGAWSIPKGETAPGEDLMACARREFAEETGLAVDSELAPLASVKQAGGKLVHAFAGPGDCDAAVIRSNSFTMEWPPGSGRMQVYPEVDRAAWFDLAMARAKLLKSQLPLIDALAAQLGIEPPQ